MITGLDDRYKYTTKESYIQALLKQYTIAEILNKVRPEHVRLGQMESYEASKESNILKFLGEVSLDKYDKDLSAEDLEVYLDRGIFHLWKATQRVYMGFAKNRKGNLHYKKCFYNGLRRMLEKRGGKSFSATDYPRPDEVIAHHEEALEDYEKLRAMMSQVKPRQTVNHELSMNKGYDSCGVLLGLEPTNNFKVPKAEKEKREVLIKEMGASCEAEMLYMLSPYTSEERRAKADKEMKAYHDYIRKNYTPQQQKNFFEDLEKRKQKERRREAMMGASHRKAEKDLEAYDDDLRLSWRIQRNLTPPKI